MSYGRFDRHLSNKLKVVYSGKTYLVRDNGAIMHKSFSAVDELERLVSELNSVRTATRV